MYLQFLTATETGKFPYNFVVRIMIQMAYHI